MAALHKDGWRLLTNRGAKKLTTAQRTSVSEEAGSPLVEGSAPGGVTGEYTFFSTDLVGETTEDAEAGLPLKKDV